MENFFCERCNKTYQTANGLWKHNQKYHNKINKEKKESICSYCDKKLSDRHSKWRHEQICTYKNKTDINKITSELKEEFKEEITKLKTELEIVKNKPSTINNINNIKNINNGIINKGVLNYIKTPGTEDISFISEKETEKILENEMNCLIVLVDCINFNENHPENHSFCTTALNDKYISTINTETLMIEKQRKKDFFDSVLFNSLKVIKVLYDKLKNKNNPKALKFKENIDRLTDFVVVNNKGKKAYVEMMNTLSFNKRHITQNTWEQLLNNEIPIKPTIDNDPDKQEIKQTKTLILNEQKIIPVKKKLIPDMTESDSELSDSNSESDEDSDEPIEMKVQGTLCLVEGTKLYKMTESKEKGELYGTFINGKVKKIKKKEVEIEV
jgi:hypothetical protein